MTEQHDYEPPFADVPSVDEYAAPVLTYADAEPTVEDEIRAAEAAQQASLCVSPDGVDDDERDACAAALAEALDLRVEINLAQHDDGGPVRRVGSTDPRVRDLEAPWTRKARRAAGSTR